jgi:hypothetical protein
MVDKGGHQTRDEKLENLIKNQSMIFMGMFEEAFTNIADKMTEALAAGNAPMADALGASMSLSSGKSGSSDAAKEIKEVAPEVRNQIGHAFSGIRQEMASQWPTNANLFKKYISSPEFDKGIEIVEKYDFGLPKLTEKLSDEVLASYVFLLKSSNQELGKMFKELADWHAGLPKPPWAKDRNV